MAITEDVHPWIGLLMNKSKDIMKRHYERCVREQRKEQCKSRVLGVTSCDPEMLWLGKNRMKLVLKHLKLTR